jgi:MoaA/NifB/PqqE/SkfB family radical SAM enzyme
MDKFSITSNDVKLYKHLDRLQMLQSGVAAPILLIITPTNKCNLNCDYCCFQNRDKKLELDYDFLKDSLTQFAKLGLKSVEITGGGQPTLYKHINELIDFIADDLKLDMGMNTNAVAASLEVIKHQVHKFKWIRLSLNFLDEERFRNAPYLEKLKALIEPMQQQTNITACYIASQNTRTTYLKDVIKFAEDNQILSRIAPDCIQSKEDIQRLIQEIKPFVQDSKYCFVSDFNVYLQDRPENFCAMHLVKPMLFTDGYVYACPSSELSLENGKNALEQFRVCKGDEAYQYYTEHFDTFTRSCTYCKYAKQNEILHAVLKDTDFNNFV